RAHGDRKTPRGDRRDELRGLARRDDERGCSRVAFHHPPVRLLEVLADGFCGVEKDRFVLASDRSVARRLGENVFYQIGLRGVPPAFRRDERRKSGVFAHLLFRSPEEIGDVEFHEVALVGVGFLGERTHGGGFPASGRTMKNEIQRFGDRARECVPNIGLREIRAAGGVFVGPGRRIHWRGMERDGKDSVDFMRSPDSILPRADSPKSMNRTLCGVYDDPDRMEVLDAMDGWLGTSHTVHVVFTSWHEGTIEDCFDRLLPQIWEAGRVPLLTWEPFTDGDATPDIPTRIAAGAFDDYLDSWAEKFREW